MLTMLYLSTWMGGKVGASNEGMCWPTVATIAETTGFDERTVRRHLKAAIERGWLSSWQRYVKRGQGWRQTVYQAQIPDSIELSDDEEKLANTVTSIDDRADDEPRPYEGQPFAVDGRRSQCTSWATQGAHSASPFKGGDVRANGHEGADKSDPTCGQSTLNVRAPVTEGADKKRPTSCNGETSGQAEVAASQLAREKQRFTDSERAGNLSEKGADTGSNKSSSKHSFQVFNSSIQPEAPAEAGGARAGNKTSSKRDSKSEIQERERKVVVFLREHPETSNQLLQSMFGLYGLTAERAADLRKIAASKADVSAA